MSQGFIYFITAADVLANLAPTYSITASPSSAAENNQTFTFTVTSSSVPNGTTLYWDLVSLSNSVTSANFNENINHGTVTINSNTGSFSLTTKPNTILGGTGNSTFDIELRIGASNGILVATTSTTTIVNTTPYYTVASNITSGNENNVDFTFTVNTTNVSNGTTVYWKIVGISGSISAANFNENISSGTMTITSGTANVSLTTKPNILNPSAGNPTWDVEIHTGSLSGPLVATTNTLTLINSTPAADTYFSYVRTLIKSNAVSSGINNTFTDATGTYTITTHGTPTQGAFTPYEPSQLSFPGYSPATYGGSTLFNVTNGTANGATDYLTTASVSISGDFTVEGWFFPIGTGGGTFFELGTYATTGIVARYLTGGIYTYWNSTGGVFGSRAVSLNTWTHIAIVRHGTGATSSTLYLNGVAQATANFATTVTGPINVGGVTFAPFIGYICDFRVTTSAVYTGNFTPNTTPLTALTNTIFLNKAIAANVYDVSGGTNFSLFNGVNVNTTTYKWNQSVYFPGTGSAYMAAAPSSANFTFGTSNWTVEAWVYITGAPGAECGMFDSRNATNSATGIIAYYGTDYKFKLAYTTSNIYCTSSTACPTNQWVHIAFVRSGSTVYIYQNGTQVASGTFGANLVDNHCLIGKSVDQIYGFQGYMEDIRITNGFARYTSAFTPPTAALSGY